MAAMIATKENNTNSSNDKGYTFELEKIDKSTVKFEITVKPDRFMQAKDIAYGRLEKETKISGFRPGKAPKSMVEAKLGARLFEEAINIVIPSVTSLVVMESKIQPLSNADYEVKELKPDFSFTYSATFNVIPEIELPDMKKIKAKPESVEVKDKEVDELFESLVKDVQKAREEKNTKKKLDETAEEKVDADKKDSEKPASKKINPEDINWAEELNMPELKTVEDVKQILKKNLITRKENEADEKFVAEFLKELIALSEIEAPINLVNQHVENREHSYVERIKGIGLDIDTFLKTQNSSLEDLRKSWKEEGEFQIATDLLFMKVAEKYELKVSGEEIDAEISAISSPETKKQYESDDARNNVATVLLRQKALEKIYELANIKFPKSSLEKKESVKKTEEKTEKKVQGKAEEKTEEKADGKAGGSE